MVGECEKERHSLEAGTLDVSARSVIERQLDKYGGKDA